MKKLLRKKPFLLPGYGQLIYGKKIRGWIQILAFWDCVLMGVLFWGYVNHEMGMPIGLLCLVLSALLWVYSYLDYLDLVVTQPPPKLKKSLKNQKVAEPEDEPEEEEEEKEQEDASVVLANTFYESGRIFYLNGELKSARKDFQKALKANEEDWDAMYQLGRVCFDLGQKKKAKKLFEQYRKTKESTKWNKETEDYLKLINKN